MTVYYTSLAHLIADLRKVVQQDKLECRWYVYTRPDILIIDEVGYWITQHKGKSTIENLAINN
jgi:DNA replication protein DnaC